MVDIVCRMFAVDQLQEIEHGLDDIRLGQIAEIIVAGRARFAGDEIRLYIGLFLVAPNSARFVIAL